MRREIPDTKPKSKSVNSRIIACMTRMPPRIVHDYDAMRWIEHEFILKSNHGAAVILWIPRKIVCVLAFMMFLLEIACINGGSECARYSNIMPGLIVLVE